MKRKKLGAGRYGLRGRSVSLWIMGDRIVAQWRERGQRRKQSWPNTPENRAYAKAWAERFAGARLRPLQLQPITTAELWRRYAEHEFPTLRPKTIQLYTLYWKAWANFAAPESIAEDLGPGTVAGFRADRTRLTWAPNTIGRAIQTVKTVYAWAYRHKLLSRNDVRDYRYKVAKEQRWERPGEYRREEFEALLAALPLEEARTWRAHAVIALCGYQGARVNAVLHLRWEDVDLEQGRIRWRPEWDKLGRDEHQPLRSPSRAILEAIRGRSGPTGYVFTPASRSNRHPIYSLQSLWVALRGAERRAGIAHRDRRALHGLRRMVFNDVMAATGDLGAAMAAIRDTDLKVASGYVRAREDQLRRAFEMLDGTGTAPVPEEPSGKSLVERTGAVGFEPTTSRRSRPGFAATSEEDQQVPVGDGPPETPDSEETGPPNGTRTAPPAAPGGATEVVDDASRSGPE